MEKGYSILSENKGSLCVIMANIWPVGGAGAFGGVWQVCSSREHSSAPCLQSRWALGGTGRSQCCMLINGV